MEAFQAAYAGVQLALRFNAVFALPAAALAAGLLARKPARGRGAGRAIFAGATLLVGWLLGDGLRAVASARELHDGGAVLVGDSPAWAAIVAVTVWAAGSLVLGYIVPAWAGVFVGRRVTWGTGFIAAVAVSAMCSGAIATLVGSIS